jgi:type VI secretion system protein ImpL
VLVLLGALILVAFIAYLIWQAHKAAHPTATALDPTQVGAVPEAGLVLPSDLPESFSGALHRLSAQTQASPDFRYALPWILLLGPPGAGKSGLVRDSSLAAVLQESVDLQTGTGLAWNFLPGGVLIEVGGWAYGASAKANEAWRRLTGLFLNHRPARPLDGVLLAIPASELIGPVALSPADLVARGALLQRRLRELTETVSFQLPLYIVITKCDLVPGFTEFAGELDEPEFEQIFGWSQPHSKLALFQPEWVDRAFDAMRMALELKQAELFAQRPPTAGRDEMFLFPGELLKLAPALCVMLTRAMRANDGVQAPLLRGIYCSGSVHERPTGAGSQAALVPVSVLANNAARGMLGTSSRGILDLTFDPAPARSGWRLNPWLGSELQVAFAHDLLLKKVFQEKGVAVPLPQRLVSRNRLRTTLQAASAMLALTLGIGTAVSFHRQAEDRAAVLGLFSDIDTDLSAQAFQGAFADGARRRTGAETIIQSIAGLHIQGLHSLFLPASYVDPVEKPIRETMVPVFSALVLAPMRSGLERRMQRIGDEDLMSPPGREADACALAPVQPAYQPAAEDENRVKEPPRRVEDLAEFQQMRGYLRQVETLEENLNRYNQLSTRGVSVPIQSVLALDAYLQCRPAVAITVQPANPYFDPMLREVQEVPIDLADGSRAISAKASVLATALYASWIEDNPVRQVTATLAERIAMLNDARAVNAQQLNETRLAFSIASTTYKNPSLAWTAAEDFEMPSDLARVTVDAFPESKLFEPSLPDLMEQIARADFLHLSAAVDQAQATLTGPIVTVADGEIDLSDNAQDLQDALANLMSLSFMTNASASDSVLPASPSSFTWDKGSLEAATALSAGYRKYLAEDLGDAPAAMRDTLRKIAETQLARTLEQSIAFAMIPAPPISATSRPADLAAQVENFSSVQPTIEALLATLAELRLSAPERQLARASVEEAVSLLNSFDTALNADAPYGVRSERFALWSAGNKPTAAIFDAPDADAVASYLAVQRASVEAYATAAQPLVAFLRAHRASLPPARVQMLSRWEGLIKAVEQYKAKQPGNSMQSLEEFLANGVNGVSPKTGCAMPALSRFSAADYFTNTAGKLRANLLLRCQALATESYESGYSRLALAFNRDLAGHFPFAPVASSVETEADPRQIANVFNRLDAASDVFASKTDMPSGNREFLDRLQASRPWFASLLNTATAVAAPTIDFTPAFRVDQADEIGGNQIIAWTLQVGSDTYRYGEPPALGHWTLNQPISLSLRWAKNAAYLPAPASGPRAPGYTLRVEGDTVTYLFDDAWSLIRMVESLSPDAQNVSTAETQDAFTLVLDVPEVAAAMAAARLQATPTARARVFLRLKLSTPAGAGDKQTINDKSFPSLAPSSPHL